MNDQLLIEAPTVIIMVARPSVRYTQARHCHVRFTLESGHGETLMGLG
jgi:hypothetical protein